MCSLLIRWGLSSVLVASLILALGCGSSKEEAKTDGDSDSAELESDTPAELETYAYDSPVQATSPWPQFRRTMGNTGRSPLVPRKAGLPLWSFAAAKGIFHAPVIDGEGTIYIGTADTTFYALKRDGSEKWRFKTGEI